jgi:hypothetical protein
VSIDNSLSHKKLSDLTKKLLLFHVLRKSIFSSISFYQEAWSEIRPVIVELTSHEVLYLFIVVVFFANLLMTSLLIHIINIVIGETPIFVQIVRDISDIFVVLVFVRQGFKGFDYIRKRKPPPSPVIC